MSHASNVALFSPVHDVDPAASQVDASTRASTARYSAVRRLEIAVSMIVLSKTGSRVSSGSRTAGVGARRDEITSKKAGY